MTINDNYKVTEMITGIQNEIIFEISGMNKIKEKMESCGLHISERTMNHFKEYISDLQSEMDAYIKNQQIFTACIEKLLDMPDVSIKEFLAIKYRYFDYMIIDDIEKQLNVSRRTLYRYLNRCEKLLEPIFASVT